MFSHHSGSQQDKIKVSAGSAPPRGPRGASFLASYPGGSQRPLAPAFAPVFVAFFPLWLCPSPLLLRTPVIGLRAYSKPRMISSQEPWLITWSLLYFQTKAYADLWADIHFFFFRGKGDTIRPTTQHVEGSSAFFPRPSSECPAFCLPHPSPQTDSCICLWL